MQEPGEEGVFAKDELAAEEDRIGEPLQVSGARVYWFDDRGRGECRLPASWRIEHLAGRDWKSVTTTEAYPVAKDKWCAVRFAPAKTTALRLVVQLPPNFAAGVHEWKVDGGDDGQ
jgi:hypothetical protein